NNLGSKLFAEITKNNSGKRLAIVLDNKLLSAPVINEPILGPNLGVVYVDDEEFVIADIPGLIEGAHLGHGLGDKFLKHIERCNLLIHLISATSDNLIGDYRTIRNELESYSSLLKNKLEIICFNKCDVLLEEEIKDKITELQKITNEEIFVVSRYTRTGLNRVIKKALENIKNTNPPNLG
ncbi:MAG: GTPase, partial [Candidatus Tisiphia sp.]